MTCKEVFDDGKVHCEGFYSDGKRGYSSFSILMHLEHEFCNACCSYCCCHPLDTGFDIYKDGYKSDYPKMIEKIKSTTQIYKEGNQMHFDLWGGEPLYNLTALKELVTVLRKEWPDCSLTVSTNGLLIGSKSIVDWIIENHIDIQLSHDGWGQWIRTKEFDPLENENCLEGFKRISDAGLFSAINCTLSYYNYSWFKNIRYFNEHLKGIKCGYIKLNHIYNSDYDIDKINENGHWQDGYKESLKGTKIGNVALRGKELDEYLQEFYLLALAYRQGVKDDPVLGDLRPYENYIMEQSKRFNDVDENKGSSGSCRAYQSYVHNVDGNYKQNWTFVINTIGDYCECNLCEEVDNPGAPMEDYCKDCKYKNKTECHPCGSMKRPKECEFLFKWLSTLEKIKAVDLLLDTIKRGSKECGKR